MHIGQIHFVTDLTDGQSIELLVRDEVVCQGAILGSELFMRGRMLRFASLVIDTKRRCVALSTLELLRGAIVRER